MAEEIILQIQCILVSKVGTGLTSIWDDIIIKTGVLNSINSYMHTHCECGTL